MFVGQWEERLHAICSHCVERGTVLHIDDPIGLFRAGRSSGSALTVGHILKGYLQDGGLALVLETSWPVWQRLQEIDRGFCDLFAVQAIDSISEQRMPAILIDATRRLEDRFSVVFHPLALRRIRQLLARFRGEREDPGATMRFVERLDDDAAFF